MCGILGITSKQNDVPIKIYEGLTYLQHRGQDSAGICNETICKKSNGLVKEGFTQEDLNLLVSNVCIGHVRYGTTGNFNKHTIQPIIKEQKNKKFSLVHNGNINNLNELSKIISKSDLNSDSEYILELFLHKLTDYEEINSQAIFEICDYLMATLKGSYSILMLIEGFGMICFRDKFGIRPLIYGIATDEYIISSESVVLEVLNYQLIRDVYPGETIIFENNCLPRFLRRKNSSLNPCLFEYIYFSRIDSKIDKINVYDARYKLGQLLGERIKKKNITDIDVIVPVPDSSLIFALGLHECLNISIQYGLVKNPYIERTFIMKDDKIINKSIKRKLNAVKPVLQGRNILIVDDSIVRGNTSSHIVYLAKKAGAKNIYMASGAPPVLYPNKYGIFIESQKELIAVNRSYKDIADVIGCNEVIYNDLDEITNCLKKINPEIVGFETSMFNNVHLF